MNTIHPTAIIHPKAELGEDNCIGPYVVIEEGVCLGSRNQILASAYLAKGTEIGDDNEIHMGAVIGHVPQDKAYQGVPTFTRIGHRNKIREYVTIHRGTKEGTATVIGDDNFFLAMSHVAHNGRIGNRVVLVNQASLSGYCDVGDDAFISGLVGVHQYCRIGRLAIVSGLSAVNRDIPPFCWAGGRPARVHHLNLVGLRRALFSAEKRSTLKQAFKILFHSGLNQSEAQAALVREFDSDEVRELVLFIESSKRGLARPIRGYAAGEEEPEEEEELV